MAGNLPEGMQDEIEMTFTMSGPADAVMRDVRRLREDGLAKRGLLRTVVFAPDRGSGLRWTEAMALPAVIEGDATAAREQVTRLVRQRRIEPNLEQKLDDLIGELERRTGRGSV